MSRFIRIAVMAGLLATTWLSFGGTASAAGGPFTCSSNFYQVINNQLELLDPVTGVYTNIGGPAAFNYNAIGYDTLDNYIYGIIHSGAQADDLVRVASDGTTTDLGLPTGLPPDNYINGSFDTSGNLYIRTDVHTIYEINVSTMTATALTTSGDALVDPADNVFINGKLYMLVNQSLSVVDLTTDVATTGTVSGPVGWNAGGGFGAGWTDQAGDLFFSNNNTGSIYQITNLTSPTPTAVFKVAGTVTSNNDGASCALAVQSPFDAPVAVNDIYATPFNTPLDETTLPLLSNDLGTGLTFTSNTSPADGTVSVNPDGSFLYTPNTGFSGTDSFNYVITDSVGRTASATVTITVSPALTPDPALQTPNTGSGSPDLSGMGLLGLTSGGLAAIGGGLGLLYYRRRLA